jgi:hypothetical protein
VLLTNKSLFIFFLRLAFTTDENFDEKAPSTIRVDHTYGKFRQFFEMMKATETKLISGDLGFEMNMNFSPNQAAQGANYANRAMNAFQTAVNIDNEQPQAEGTTFWFRWLIRVVAVTTGGCK